MSTSTWTFTQGLLIGQASFVVLFLLFVRYVVFEPSPEVDEEGWRRRRSERVKRAALSTTAVPPPPHSTILGKTGYEMATHPAESTDWLNVLFAQILQGYRNDLLSSGGEEGARQRIEKWLNPESGAQSWLDPIQVTSLSLGSAFPLLSNARIRPADGQGHIRGEIDVDYLDSLHLSLSTSVLINFPRPRFAVLPVSLGVELVSIGGTLSTQIHDPSHERQHLHASLLPDFHLNLKTTSLLGSRAKLQGIFLAFQAGPSPNSLTADIPKLEQLILSRLRQIIQDRLVYPNHLSLALPRLLSPSVQSTPIIKGLGDDAINAVTHGIGDLIGLELADGDDLLEAENDELEYSTILPPGPSTPKPPMNLGQATSHFGHPQTPLAQSHLPHPSYARSPSSAAPRPPQTPLIAHPPPPLSATTSFRPPGSSTASLPHSRFRGQFASQPATPGIR
ncbi:hypothetical protein P7C73_g3347, partial [Tremellales sp. Uapishka_1]